MKRLLAIGLLLGVTWYSTVEGLEDYNHYREGACSGIWSKSSSHANRHQNINITWVDTLHYNSAGSKYHMYKMASPHPRYEHILEDEFYYDFCYKRNTSSNAPVAVGTGFGKVLETWDVRTRPDLPGVYIEATPRYHLDHKDVLRQRITFTDNKTFAFLLDCWVGSNQRAWNVVSNTPSLSPQAKKMIENHALALGFSRKNFIFLRYDSCEMENPLTGKGFVSSGEGWSLKGPRSTWKVAPTTKPTTTTTTTKKTTPRPPLKRVTVPTLPSKMEMVTKSHEMGMKGHEMDNHEGSGWSKE